MKPAAATGLLLLLATSASAQFSLIPQVGMERSRTTVDYNQLGSFSPLGTRLGLSASLRLDYRFKMGHGPFAAITTGPGVMEWTFVNPSAAMSGPVRSGPIQWRLEAGYQYSSHPINLRNHSAKTTENTIKGSRSSFGCGASRKPFRQQALNMRIQPSLAFAWLPTAGKDLSNKSGSYVYRAGNYSTAIVPGLSIELGRGKERLMNLGFYYTAPLRSGEVSNISSVENGKPVSNSFTSDQSSWSLRIGLPVSLTHHKKSAAPKTEQKKQCTNRCESYRLHCVHKI